MKASSFVMHTAHTAYVQTPMTWSEAVRLAWQMYYIRKAMSNGIVEFYYLKSDGTVRQARGTLCNFLMPEDKRPKGIVNTHTGYSAIAYFDLDKGEWRSFSVIFFIEIKACFGLSASEKLC